MIFTPTNVELILSGKKTQTRRLVKKGDFFDEGCAINSGVGVYKAIQQYVGVLLEDQQIKYGVGRTYAIQPGRGKKAVARMRITSIEMQHLQSITDADAQKEGYRDREEFQSVWSFLHQRPKTRWSDNPQVWVISFEVIK